MIDLCFDFFLIINNVIKGLKATPTEIGVASYYERLPQANIENCKDNDNTNSTDIEYSVRLEDSDINTD